MAARERGLAEILVRIDARIHQGDHWHDIARRRVRIGKRDRLSFQVLQAFVWTVGTYGQDREIAGRAVQPLGGYNWLDAAFAVQPRGCIPGAADTGHLQVSRHQRLADAGIIGSLEQLHFDAEFLLGVFDVDLVAIDGRHLVFESENAEVDRRILVLPTGKGRCGCQQHDCSCNRG